MSRRAILLAPGLLGPLRGLGAPSLPPLPAPTLVRWRARARIRRGPTGDLAALAGALFGTSAAGQAVAAQHAAGAARGPVLLAEPLHLPLVGEAPLVLRRQALALDAAAAGELRDALADHLRAEGLCLTLPTSDQWLLQPIDQPPPLLQVLAGPSPTTLQAPLPWPPDAAARRLLTELQMLLHELPANQRREAQGLAPVNTLWCYGAGPLDTPTGPRGIDRVCADELVVRGLAHAAALPVTSLADAEAGAGVLLATDAPQNWALAGDWGGYEAAVAALESTVLAPLERALQQGDIDLLELYTGADRWHIRRRARWWRRRHDGPVRPKAWSVDDA
ncbi:MAG TPA: hypothetical protein QF361_11550 [Gammaproteobacteria bacterium]|nr:hypothetical protein [Gammaproteobacteria bacterium]